MSETKVIGMRPWLPWPLSRYSSWSGLVRAERLAAFRIGVAIVLLFDILGTYWPRAGDFFGRDSLGSPEVFATAAQKYRWSVLRLTDDPTMLQSLLVLWAVSAACLLVGWLPRLSAAVAWIFSTSVIGLNFYLHNSGDSVRSIALFYLMLSPCGAVWRWRPWPNKEPDKVIVYVSAWPVRLLALQLTVIYLVNGVYKLAGGDWRDGHIMHDVLCNLGWTRFSYAQLPLPDWSVSLMTWSTLVFELGFPLFFMTRATRLPILVIGAIFHVGTALLLRLGPFPFYMICLYLPFVPWEDFTEKRKKEEG
jgi:hypothetical protein